MGNNQRSGTNGAYSSDNYCSQAPYALNATIFSQAVTDANGITYSGDENGYLHAINLVTRKEVWKTFLGTTTVPGCNPESAGVSSTPAIVNGVIYVGGGDQYWYALSQSTGHILWSFTPGTTLKPNLAGLVHIPQAITVTPAMKAAVSSNAVANNGFYNWSSPLIVGNSTAGFYAYIGTASFGDCPLVQGHLILMRLSDHKVMKVFKTVPDGTTGGGIWGSPSTDAPFGTPLSSIKNVYITDGNGTMVPSKQPYAESVIQLDANTLSVKSSFGLPQAINPGLDFDWGSSPVFFTDSAHHTHIAAVNKNGMLYIFDANHLTTRVVSFRIGAGGDAPQGGATISSCTSVASQLYCGGSNTKIGSVTYKGSLTRIDTTLGSHSVVWQKGFTDGFVLGALASSTTEIIVPSGSHVLLLNALTGHIDRVYVSSTTIWASPSLYKGTITVGNLAGQISILGQLA